MRFSDECHFGWTSAGGREYISRKPGDRNKPACIRQRPPKERTDQQPLHIWSAVGWNFKGPLVRYQVAHSNGKLSQRAYIDQILDPVVRPWLEEGQDFILLEDNDSGHGPSRNNPVRQWKEANGLSYFFNVVRSPNLNIIENCWRAPEAWVLRNWVNIRTTDDMYATALAGWNALSQQDINRFVLSMPTRLQHILELDGQLSAYEQVSLAELQELPN